MKIMGIIMCIFCSSMTAAEGSDADNIAQGSCGNPGGGWQFGCYQYANAEECSDVRYCRWSGDHCVVECD